jgi:hypothetical protein
MTKLYQILVPCGRLMQRSLLIIISLHLPIPGWRIVSLETRLRRRIWQNAGTGFCGVILYRKFFAFVLLIYGVSSVMTWIQPADSSGFDDLIKAKLYNATTAQIVRYGDYFFLTSEFLDNDGKGVNVDFLIGSNDDQYKVLQTLIDQRKVVRDIVIKSSLDRLAADVRYQGDRAGGATLDQFRTNLQVISPFRDVAGTPMDRSSVPQTATADRGLVNLK